MFKKLLGAFCITVILSSAMISQVLAAEECPACRSITTFSYSCTGQEYDYQQVDCWCRNTYTDGYYHTSDCMIYRWYYLTKKTCNTCGSRVEYFGSHLHMAIHTSGGPVYLACPY